MPHDGKVHKRGTSGVEFVVEVAHRVWQGVVVIIKMGEILRPCHDWHSRHDCLVCGADCSDYGSLVKCNLYVGLERLENCQGN